MRMALKPPHGCGNSEDSSVLFWILHDIAPTCTHKCLENCAESLSFPGKQRDAVCYSNTTNLFPRVLVESGVNGLP